MVAIVSAAHHYVPGIEYTAKTVIESMDDEVAVSYEGSVLFIMGTVDQY